MQNHYYNSIHPLRPYTCSLPATPGTAAPLNALRGDTPAIKKGFWPCEKNGAWAQIEDHRERTESGGFPPEARQEGTKYWLPEDTYGTPARKMKEIGPLPENARLTPPERSFEEALEAKLAEILNGANLVKTFLSSRFSALEEATWPEQEAGARALLNDAVNVKDKTARLILLDETGTAKAADLVNRLAATDGTTPEEFAARIIANADLSYQAGIVTLMEQRALEAAAHAAKTREELLAVTVTYSAVQ